MEGANEKVDNEAENAPQLLPNELLEKVFMKAPEHWQIHTATFVSRFFLVNRYKTLCRIRFNLDLNTLLSDPVFQQHPIDFFQLFERGKSCLPLMAQRFTSGLCVAAFTGNITALNALMADELLEPLDETGCRIVHFLALGGQKDLLLSLVETHGPEILQVSDNLGHSLMHFAAMGMNIKLIKLLIDKFHFQAKQTGNMFGQTWLHMLANREISESNLLILSDIIVEHETFQETKNQLLKGSYDLTSLDFIPDFSGQYELKNPESLDQLIMAVTREIVKNRQSHFDAYLCYLIAFKQLNPVQRDNFTSNTL